MTDDLVVGRCVPLQGGSYIGLHRKDPEMAEKKKAKPTEVEGLVVKIGVDVDATAISEATSALKELAAAANLAREALDRLCGEPNVEIVCDRQDPLRFTVGDFHDSLGSGGGGGSGVRPAGNKFKL